MFSLPSHRSPQLKRKRERERSVYVYVCECTLSCQRTLSSDFLRIFRKGEHME